MALLGFASAGSESELLERGSAIVGLWMRGEPADEALSGCDWIARSGRSGESSRLGESSLRIDSGGDDASSGDDWIAGTWTSENLRFRDDDDAGADGFSNCELSDERVLRLLRCRGVDSSSGSRLSKSYRSPVSLASCTCRMMLACRGRRLKLANASIEASAAGVPRIRSADAGAVVILDCEVPSNISA